MRAFARTGLLALTLTVAVGRAAAAQNAPTPPAADPNAAKALAEKMKQTLATVNGETITRGELVDFLSRYELPPGNEEQIYRDAIDSLVNSHLVNQYLVRQKVQVPREKVDEAVESLERDLKSNGSSLAAEIQRSGKSMDEIRQELANRIRWINFVNEKATDAELKRFADTHKDLFSGTQVKASHILLKVDPKASAEDKEKVRQKLLGIKRDIEANKITFAEAANKYSEDPGNTQGAGGDIGTFTLNQGIIEEFTKPAFALKKGQMSDVVETPYGLHLILVTDRKEGNPFDFEQNKPLVKQVYAAELQKNLLSAERKTAKIDIKPMPSDLFPSPPPTTDTAKPEPKK